MNTLAAQGKWSKDQKMKEKSLYIFDPIKNKIFLWGVCKSFKI